MKPLFLLFGLPEFKSHLILYLLPSSPLGFSPNVGAIAESMARLTSAECCAIEAATAGLAVGLEPELAADTC